ncbi:MAG TPA: M36 family metallopeptidase [Thermoanaerobaculia bacterium]|nr:M36 family metallopeptidase [Thermoanaerobaculia bacterium]
MRKFALSFLAVLVAASAFAAPPAFRGQAPQISRSDNGLTTPSNAAAADVVRGYLKHADRTLAVERENQGARGVKHLLMQQSIGGRAVYGAYVKASVDGQGRLTSVIDASVAPGAVKKTSLSAEEARAAAFAFRFGASVPALYRQPVVTPVIVPMSDGTLEEGFLVETWELRSNDLWHTIVGSDGAVVHQEHRTNSDSYFVYQVHPGAAPQALVSGPGSTGTTESPSGWVASNTTIGNNVDAYLDRDNNNGADAGGRPVSATQDFVYTHDPLAAPTTSTNQMLAVANLFYLNNVIHDKLHRHGFNEAAGNFQTNNFGRGGAGNDPVNAEAQDGGGTNNANFSTPGDGSRPRMQMYLWNTATPSRDGDVDSDVVFHEYGHGLTWRMIGSMGGGLAGAIGEGMSDTVACYMNGEDRVGEYVKNNTTGIRRYRYEGYPLSYGDAAGTSVHADGEIYAAAMWKLRSLWLASGRTMDSLWSYVIDGMNYTPSNPEYEEMRDGILASMPTQAEDCVVWDAFSQFGIGQGAAGTDSCFISCTISVQESFAKPAICGGTPPPTDVITLSTRGYRSSNRPRVDLTWSGSTAANVDVFRNGTRITTTANDGTHTDTSLAKNAGGTFTYRVCNAGTTTCSNDSSVSF